MTTQERLRELIGTIPNYIFDYLELSDEIKQEWKKGSKASDFGGHKSFIAKYEQAILQLIETEIIGEDEPNPFTENYDFRNPVDEAKKIGRNQLRAEQRTTLRGEQ